MKKHFTRTSAFIIVPALLITGISCVTAFAVDPDLGILKVGDIDRNGIVDINDVTYLQKALCDINPMPTLEEADLNKDGKINIIDATFIQKLLVGIVMTTGSTEVTTLPPTELPVVTTRPQVPTVDPKGTDPDGWQNQIIKP